MGLPFFPDDSAKQSTPPPPVQDEAKGGLFEVFDRKPGPRPTHNDGRLPRDELVEAITKYDDTMSHVMTRSAMLSAVSGSVLGIFLSAQLGMFGPSAPVETPEPKREATAVAVNAHDASKAEAPPAAAAVQAVQGPPIEEEVPTQPPSTDETRVATPPAKDGSTSEPPNTEVTPFGSLSLLVGGVGGMVAAVGALGRLPIFSDPVDTPSDAHFGRDAAGSPRAAAPPPSDHPPMFSHRLPDRTPPPGADDATLSRVDQLLRKETKTARFGMLDAPTWGAAATALNVAAADASARADLSKKCDAGVATACDALSREGDAKTAWLSKLDAHSLGAAAKVVSEVAEVASTTPSSKEEGERAKAAWRTSLDAPSWGQAAKVVSEAMSDAVEMAALSDKCDEGDAAACDSLSSEEEAKRAWLSRLDVPSWGKLSAAVSEVAQAATEATSAAPPTSVSSAAPADVVSSEADTLWKGELDAPAWGKAADALKEAAADATTMADLTRQCEDGEAKACDTLSRETGAKEAWLSKLETPSWGKAAAALSDAAAEADVMAALTEMCHDGDEEACELLAEEAEAKQAWIKSLGEVPVGALGSDSAAASSATPEDEPIVVPDVGPVAAPRVTEETVRAAWLAKIESEATAKAAWLMKLDGATWDTAAAALTQASTEASILSDLTEQCEAGDDEACELLSAEEGPKKAWLSKLDAPTWDAAADVVSGIAEMASAVSLEAEAKDKWLAKLDAPTWGKAAKAVSEVMSQAVEMAALTEMCEGGDDAACDVLSREEASKKAWLARLDVPSWGKLSAAVSEVAFAASEATATAKVDEEAARAAWLSKLDPPTFPKGKVLRGGSTSLQA